jgi:DNA-binding NtrC family response regulator
MACQVPLKRLLVVEDDPDQCRALQHRLELYGYAVSCAEDGEAAMAMLQVHPFDGVLLDLNLPHVSGLEVLAHTRDTFPALPVILMSVSQSGLRAAQASHAAACEYLAKPYGITEFKQAVQSCFGPAHQPVAP